MRGEPETGKRFQREMSLKRKCWMLRMNDYPHEEFGAADSSRDEGVCDDQPPRGLVSSGGSSGLRVHRAGTEDVSVSPVEERAKGDREELPGQGHGLEPRASYPTDPALDPDAAYPEKAGPAPEFS